MRVIKGQTKPRTGMKSETETLLGLFCAKCFYTDVFVMMMMIFLPVICACICSCFSSCSKYKTQSSAGHWGNWYLLSLLLRSFLGRPFFSGRGLDTCENNLILNPESETFSKITCYWKCKIVFLSWYKMFSLNTCKEFPLTLDYEQDPRTGKIRL